MSQRCGSIRPWTRNGASVCCPHGHVETEGTRVHEGDLERFESEVEYQIYREYRDVLPLFRFVVETERRFYLANSVDVREQERNGTVYFEILLEDAWVWDMYRPARFLTSVRILSFRDVNIEEVEQSAGLRPEPPT